MRKEAHAGVITTACPLGVETTVPLQDAPGIIMLINHPTTPASISKKMNESFEKSIGAQSAWTATAAATVPAALTSRSPSARKTKYKANRVIEKPAKPKLAINMAEGQAIQSGADMPPIRLLERRYSDASAPNNSKVCSAAGPPISTLSARPKKVLR